jgi:hypothetical protein
MDIEREGAFEVMTGKENSNQEMTGVCGQTHRGAQKD